jgi:hypothetical protein
LKCKTEKKGMQAAWVHSFGLANNDLDGREEEEIVTTFERRYLEVCCA